MKRLILVLLCLTIIQPIILTAGERIPPVLREMRATWVATVANIDWPSFPGLSSAEQKKEAIVILDRLKELNMNTVVLQVRPHADALYKSELEPWSSYLTGQQGKAPDSLYDPLEFWIQESHARGIELHAWFNPYRVRHPAMKGDFAPNAFVKIHPECVRRLADTGYYWMDPGMKKVQDHSFAVIMDVVKRYDIDGVQFDDYFYPYREYNPGKDFSDDESFRTYQASGGKKLRDDWRRDAVNKFVHRIYRGIKQAKPWVKFGISPFGVCRPGCPVGYGSTFDQYATLYADTKLWWKSGWVDYFAPQLYWPISRIQLSFPMLLGWWNSQNTKRRHLWPGIYIRPERSPVNVTIETVNQIMVARGMLPQDPGIILYSMTGLLAPKDSMLKTLKEGAFAAQALVPASPWLDRTAPKSPVLRYDKKDGEILFVWQAEGKEKPFLYVFSVQQDGKWVDEILPASVIHAARKFDGTNITSAAISAVDRCGNESKKRILAIQPDSPAAPK